MKKMILFLLLVLSQAAFGQWEECNNGLYGPPIMSLAVDGNTIVAGSGTLSLDDICGGGIYLSTDNGNTWHEKYYDHDYSIGYSIKSLAISGNNIYAGTGYYNDGLLVSKDFGETWKSITAGLLPVTDIESLLINGNDLFVVEESGGVYKLTYNQDNNVDLFIPKNKGIGGGGIKSLVTSGNYMFAASFGGGVFRTNDNAENWVSVNNGLVNLKVNSISIVGFNLYVGTTTGIFHSSDNGDTWIQKENWLKDQVILNVVQKNNFIFAGTEKNGVFVSSDYGDTWNQENTGMSDKEIRALAIGNNCIIAGNNSGIAISSNNGKLWEPKNRGLTRIRIRDFTVLKDNILAASFGQGVFKSTDKGYTWFAKNKGLENKYIISMVNDSNYIFAGTYGDTLFRSSDKGETWEKKHDGLTNPIIYSLAIDSNIVLAGTQGNGVFISTDFGEKWKPLNKGIEYGTNVLGLAIINHNYIAATDEGILLYTQKVKAWESRLNTIGYSLKVFNDIVISSTSNGVYLSTDFGECWINKHSKIGGVYSFAILDSNIFASTDNGVSLSTNKCESWGKNSEVLPYYATNSVMSLAISGKYIYAGTSEYGIYRAKLSDFGIVDVQEKRFNDNIITIQPNPASENITVSLNNGLHPIIQNCSLSIYNSLGIEIKRFTEIELAGQTSLNFSTEGLASGIYYCTYTSGTDNITKSFIVIK
ncbi:MAG: T9SS type A sorting domain-containing protein [bacterium]